VIDNDSDDRTVEEATAAGARILVERRRGKGYAVQTAFERVDADAYLMVDGDDTYPADKAPELLAPVLRDEADMVVGSRLTASSVSRFRLANRLGNEFYRRAVNLTFGTRLSDILSGYRCLSRRVVQGLPLFVTGFEVEAELTIKSLERGYRIVEVPVDLGSRPSGSLSKIRIVQDGFRILATILALFRDYKPLTFFGGLGLALLAAGAIAGFIAFRSGTMAEAPFGPLPILAIALLVAGVSLLAVGLVLHTVNRRFQELERYIRLLARE
jgi:glycosyltransferase involved in cell wall biosynthesis